MRATLRALYRARGLMFYSAAVILIANVVVLQFPLHTALRTVWPIIVLAAMASLLSAVLLAYLALRRLFANTAAPPTRVVRSPVAGRWLGMNSPATKVPSHGTRAYGQAYAIDLVAEPQEGVRPSFGDTAMRAAEAYPAFGQPVLAMVDGTVVRASGWQRDHRARSSLLGLLYLGAEGLVRQVGGPGFIVGSHVTIRSDDGTYAAVGHLRRGSVAVRVGDRVTAGTTIGECGNSGNSSEPHVHAQLMDRASFWTAEGLPMAFTGITIGEDPTQVTALPADGEHMHVAAGAREPRTRSR